MNIRIVDLDCNLFYFILLLSSDKIRIILHHVLVSLHYPLKTADIIIIISEIPSVKERHGLTCP